MCSLFPPQRAPAGTLARLFRDFRKIALPAVMTTMIIARPPSVDPMPAPASEWPAVAARNRKRRRQDEPREASADYSRYSSLLQDETTTESQQETCDKKAIEDGQPIDPASRYVDSAISGTKLRREGLDRLLADAAAGRFNRLYFYSLSRLARESIIGMPILKRLVYVYKVRIISATEGVDSAREGWEQLAQILLMQHERYVTELSKNVFRGQKSNLKNGFSNGDFPFGYTSVPVAGSEQTRRGRHAKPRMVYAVDPEKSTWVKRIFAWFVSERRTIRWITRELNRLGAPKDHRSKDSKLWHHNYVARVLGNRKYVGDWAWGEMQNVRDPETGLIHQEPRPAEETDAYRRTFKHLQLIDDQTFATAQAILFDNRKKFAHGRNEDGKFLKGRDGAPPPPASHLLNGIIACDQSVDGGVCGKTFHVGGSNGKYLFCPNSHGGACSCRTTLPRRLAEQMILEQIGARILNNPDWLRAVFEATRRSWIARRQTLPDELRSTQAAIDETKRKIARLVDMVENSDKPDPDVTERLAERRAELRELQARLSAAQQAEVEQPSEPTEEWVRAKIADLGNTLATATPAAAYALRGLLDGPIKVREIRVEGKKRHFLRGTFRVGLGMLAGSLGSRPAPQQDQSGELSEEITIDFRRPDPRDEACEQVKALWDQDLHQKEIARRLGFSKNLVKKLLRHWSRRHGVELPDGRARRGRIPPSAEHLPLYRRIADQVMELCREERELGEIAKMVGHDRNTVTNAIRFWHESRGLPVPDGRTRRWTLPKPPSEEGNHGLEPGQEDLPAA